MDRHQAEQLAGFRREFGDWFNRSIEFSITLAKSSPDEAADLKRSLASVRLVHEREIRYPAGVKCPDLFKADQ